MQFLEKTLGSKNLPSEISGLVDSYLDLRSLANWRGVNSQAHKDVEAKVRKIAFDMEDNYGGNFLQEPAGPLLGSSWFQFMTNVYMCESCGKYESPARAPQQLNYDVEEAEELQLCGTCFLSLNDVSSCEKCQVYTSNGTACHHCDNFFCEECQEDIIDMCVECSELYCDECRLDTNCVNCTGIA
jgi:hypothetical protein